MHNPERDAKRYRDRAEAFRAMAENAVEPRESYLTLAKAYDDCAARLDLIAATIRELVQGIPERA